MTLLRLVEWMESPLVKPLYLFPEPLESLRRLQHNGVLQDARLSLHDLNSWYKLTLISLWAL